MGIDKDAVFLLTSADGSKKAFGTGFAIAYKDGQLYLLTCAHVADQLDGKVKVGGYEAEAEILAKGSADSIDMALLRIPCEQPPPLLNHAVRGKEGLKFFICGYGPFAGAKDNYVLRHIEGKLGKSIAFESPSSGRVEAWDLHVEDDDFSRLQGGYSGSPLCDEEGGLLAVVSHKVDAGQRGHAVAIANLKRIYKDIDQFFFVPPRSNSSFKKAKKIGILALVLSIAGIFSFLYMMSIRKNKPSIPTLVKETVSPSPKPSIPTLVKETVSPSPKPSIPTLVKETVSPSPKPSIPTLVKETVSPSPKPSIPTLVKETVSPLGEWNVKKGDPYTQMKIVQIPEGCFQMGSSVKDQDRFPQEEPATEVCVSSFWMGQYEVTQSQWEKIMGNNPSYFNKKSGEYPVEQVSFEKVQEFIEKLNGMMMEVSGKKGKYRLPTEAEWEYAARSGTTTSRYWGNENIACDKAMYENHPVEHKEKDNNDSCIDYVASRNLAIDHTAPVGSYPPNQFGLYDMLGNVWEWCSDWYQGEGYYASISKENPIGPLSGTQRVIRGGCWRDDPGLIRSAFRRGYDPKTPARTIGFRIVLPD